MQKKNKGNNIFFCNQDVGELMYQMVHLSKKTTGVVFLIHQERVAQNKFWIL